jgi:SAM-dependent methyltransferase
VRIPWLRSNFLARRRLDQIVFDFPDFVLRAASGRRHWPPYSLRSFVGGAQDFEQTGKWFVHDLQELGLLAPGMRILDIGCGCGRVAQPLSIDPAVRQLLTKYIGIDVDRAVIRWCQRHITPRNPRFQFFHADCHSSAYNPHGLIPSAEYRFPFPDSSFDLILLTSVFTHVLPDELRHYLIEAGRLLAPGGMAYATFFFVDQKSAITERTTPGWSIRFPYSHGHYAVASDTEPTIAVAYDEMFVRQQAGDAGLRVIEPPRYSSQDLLLFCKKGDPRREPELKTGWHELEKGRWRWTERIFDVKLSPADGDTTLRFRFTIAKPLLEQLGSVRLRATAGKARLPEGEYTTHGEHLYVQALPPEVLTGKPITIRFELNGAFGPTPIDRRELGLQVVFWSYLGSPFDTTLQPQYPITIS